VQIDGRRLNIMKKPEYDENRKMWIVNMDDYSNGLLFYDNKTAWKFYQECLASGKTDDEIMGD
jgi:ligand-binding sensor domain-containing protein